MHTSRIAPAIAAAITALTLGACAHSSHAQHKEKFESVVTNTADMRQDVTALSKSVAALTESVAALKAGQDKLLAAIAPEGPTKAAKAKPRPGQADPDTVYAYPVGAAPTAGPKNAWVTIVEISDMQCPFCSRVNSTLKQLRETYGDDVRIAFKHNPLSFHDQAMPAATAAMCAHEQQQFWPMHDAIFAEQRNLSDEVFGNAAKQIKGLKFNKWQGCIKQDSPAKHIAADQAEAANFGARGTPTFFINGRFVGGARGFEFFKELVDEELSKAKASGIAKNDYYAKAVLGKGKSKVE